MQACNTEPSNGKDKRKKESLGSKLKNLFIRD
jgi:hypothetical protein